MVIKIQKKSFKGCENDIHLKYIAKIEKVLCSRGLPQPYLYDRFTFPSPPRPFWMLNPPYFLWHVGYPLYCILSPSLEVIYIDPMCRIIPIAITKEENIWESSQKGSIATMCVIQYSLYKCISRIYIHIWIFI